MPGDDTDRSPLGQEVLVGSPPRRERADAARNRLKVLEAAERLFAEKGADGVSMDDVVAAAGVGKGTLYRRFGDKSGLAVALLDERERTLQALILSGGPPLGPGAPARDRLRAFVEAYLEYELRHLDLVRMSQTASPGARLTSGVHRFWVQHVALLLRETGAPAPRLRAEVLLAGLAAEQVADWVKNHALAPDELVKTYTEIALDLCGTGK